MRSFVCLALASGLFLFTSAASAESGRPPARCELFISPHGVSIPANVPALVVRRSEAAGGVARTKLTPSETPEATLRTVDDGIYTFVAPDRPFEAGTSYTIEVEPRCTMGVGVDGGSTGPAVATFTASTPTELPTSLGTLGNPRFENGYYVVRLTPSAELDAFMPVARLDAVLGGVVTPVIEYGGRAARGPFDLHLPSPDTICLPNDTLVREATFELRAKVAGSTTTIAPQEVKVLFDCARYAATHPSRDGGVDDTVDDGGGCQTAPAGASSALLSFALALTAAGAVRRARRKRAGSRG